MEAIRNNDDYVKDFEELSFQPYVDGTHMPRDFHRVFDAADSNTTLFFVNLLHYNVTICGQHDPRDLQRVTCST
jgi:hypothetical protein